MVSHMKIEALWLSQPGTRTKDNRDHAGIGARSDEFLGVVVDGSTRGSTNGDYARAIVEMLVDWFVATADAWSPDLALTALRHIHETLRERFPRGSASLLLLHAAEHAGLTTIHCGDCLLGEIGDDIVWQTTPHTLANVFVEMPLKDVARSPARHLLTRSIRAREYMAPDVTTRDQISGSFLLATDGFWAELTDQEQTAFPGGNQSTGGERDDRSILKLRIFQGNPFTISLSEGSSVNLYNRL